MTVPTPHDGPGDRPATPIPAGLARRLRDGLAAVAAEVEEEVRKQVPEYARSEGAVGGRLRTGVVEALTLFVDHVTGSGEDGGDTITATYHQLGGDTARAGRSLEALQSALRVGGMHAWRLLGRTAEDLGVDSAVVSALGELAFRTVHEVAEAAAAGYAAATLDDLGELERRRRRLLDLLLGERPAAPNAVQELARGARWTVPERVAVVVFAADSGDLDEEPPPSPAGALTDVRARPPRLLLPDPDSSGSLEGRRLALTLRGRPAAIGPAVPPAEAAHSLRWATRALRLMERGILPRQGLLRCADHLSTLLLHGDEPLLAHLRSRALAPLETVARTPRARLRETLLAWLLCGGSVPGTADRLNVHAQTVRYRLRQLDRLFGDRLYDPATRLELILALQAPASP
ncbi:PucR family transcriptional regulator [Streptomyces humi]|uniref:PucR family transcriptional regulator n=1 Tax=Streptomyces humi TaxID=1428620 RepID=UPI0006288668|nr:PucR family transcriptional regulator [Streptomyces humi]